jgi:hypothetical protein
MARRLYLRRALPKIAGMAMAILLLAGIISAPAGALPAQTAATMALSTSLTPSTYGQAITFTATLSGLGALLAGGSVTFDVDGTAAGTGSLSTGKATITLSNVGVGTHAITATYPGDALNSAATGTLSGGQTVTKAASTTKLSSSANPDNGVAVILTASVAPVAPGGGTPAGSVAFSSGTTSLGTSTLSGGLAYLTVYTLPVGTDALSAVYAGDSNFTGSSGSLSEQVIVAAPPKASAAPAPTATPSAKATATSKTSPTPTAKVSARPTPSPSVTETATPAITDTVVPSASPFVPLIAPSPSPTGTTKKSSSSLPLIALLVLLVVAAAAAVGVTLRRRRMG